MNNFEVLHNVHPVFKSFKNHIYFFEAVEKKNTHGVLQNRHLVIHTAGIFLLEAKTFQKSFSISRFIPTFAISSLSVSSDFVSVQGNNTEMILKHKKHLKIASYIYAIRLFLYDHQHLQFSFSIDPKLREVFDGHFTDIRSENLIADRFLGAVFTTGSNYVEDVIKNSYDMLCSIKDEILLNSSMMNHSFIRAIIIAISYGIEVNSIIFDGFELGHFVFAFRDIIQHSRSVHKIIFRNVSFSTNFQELDQIFKSHHLIRLTDLLFEKCKLISPDISSFFDSFSHLNSEIKLLYVHGCMLTHVTLDIIFQSLFFSNCFHSLEVLSISDASLCDDLSSCIFQLLCCGWVLEKRCLKQLTLRNCGLAIDSLLVKLNSLDCGILTLDLGGNSFSGLKGKLGLHSLNSLVLDKCQFNGDQLTGLFIALQEENLKNPLHIDLTDIIVDSKAFSNFYQNSNKIKVQHLYGLVWDGNPISSTTIEAFVTFLKNQPDLELLSISRCIPKTEHQRCLPFLIDLVRNKSFEQFCIGAKKGEHFGVPLVSVIEGLLNRSQIRILDVSNQCIGDIGLFLIVREMGASLEELWFDGFSPTNPDSFIEICQRILSQSSLRIASWPASDIPNVISKVPQNSRPNFLHQLGQLKSDFRSRFGDTEEEFHTHINTTSMKDVLSVDSIPTSPTKPDLAPMKQNLIAEFEYIQYDSETSSLLDECSSIIGIKPILSVYDSLVRKTSISQLTSLLIK